jgi:hypothetical protein
MLRDWEHSRGHFESCTQQKSLGVPAIARGGEASQRFPKAARLSLDEREPSRLNWDGLAPAGRHRPHRVWSRCPAASAAPPLHFHPLPLPAKPSVASPLVSYIGFLSLQNFTYWLAHRARRDVRGPAVLAVVDIASRQFDTLIPPAPAFPLDLAPHARPAPREDVDVRPSRRAHRYAC